MTQSLLMIVRNQPSPFTIFGIHKNQKQQTCKKGKKNYRSCCSERSRSVLILRIFEKNYHEWIELSLCTHA